MSTSRRRILLGALPLLLTLKVCGQTVKTATSPKPPVPAVSGDDFRLEVVGQLSGPSRAVAVRGEHAYVGMGRRLVVVDVADPAQPHEVGDLDVPEGVQGVAVDGDVGYLLLPDGTLRVLDLSTPTAPRQISAFTAPRHPAEALALAVTRGHVLVVGAEGVQTIDVREPTAPREAGFVVGGGVDIAADGDQAFVASGAGLAWFDIADLAHPRLITRVAAIGNASAVTYNGDLVAVATWPDTQFCPRAAPRLTMSTTEPSPRPSGLTPPTPHASCVHLLDVSRPPDPAALAQIEIVRQDTNATRILPGGLRMAGNRLYVLDRNDNYFGGHSSDLRTLDLADPARPVELSSALVATGLQLALAGDRGYVALEDGGLGTIDMHDPATTSAVSYLRTPADAHAVVAAPGHAYLGDHQRVGLAAVDVADPTTPRAIGFRPVGDIHFNADDVVSDLALAGSNLFAVSGHVGLVITDVSDPAYMTRAGGLSVGDARTVAVAPPYVYVGSLDGSLRVVDVADVGQPKELGQLVVDAAHPLMDLVAGAGLVYGVDGTAMRVIDVADPAKPRAVSYTRPTAGASALAVAGGLAYVSGDGGGVSILDVANASFPREIGRLPGDAAVGAGRSIAVSGRYAFIGHASGQLWAVDVSDPARPGLAATLDLPSPALGIAVLGDHLYVAAGEDGLVVIKVAGAGFTPTPTPAATAEATPTDTPAPFERVFLPWAGGGLRNRE